MTNAVTLDRRHTDFVTEAQRSFWLGFRGNRDPKESIDVLRRNRMLLRRIPREIREAAASGRNWAPCFPIREDDYVRPEGVETPEYLLPTQWLTGLAREVCEACAYVPSMTPSVTSLRDHEGAVIGWLLIVEWDEDVLREWSAESFGE